MTEKRRPPSRTLDEARQEAPRPPEPDVEPPVPEEPPAAEDLEEVAHWCLLCADPGVAGPDILGNWYCTRHWAEREARMAALRKATNGVRAPQRDPGPRPKADDRIREDTEALLDRLRHAGGHTGPTHHQERMPYRDDEPF